MADGRAAHLYETPARAMAGRRPGMIRMRRSFAARMCSRPTGRGCSAAAAQHQQCGVAGVPAGSADGDRAAYADVENGLPVG